MFVCYLWPHVYVALFVYNILNNKPPHIHDICHVYCLESICLCVYVQYCLFHCTGWLQSTLCGQWDGTLSNCGYSALKGGRP